MAPRRPEMSGDSKTDTTALVGKALDGVASAQNTAEGSVR